MGKEREGMGGEGEGRKREKSEGEEGQLKGKRREKGVTAKTHVQHGYLTGPSKAFFSVVSS